MGERMRICSIFALRTATSARAAESAASSRVSAGRILGLNFLQLLLLLLDLVAGRGYGRASSLDLFGGRLVRPEIRDQPVELHLASKAFRSAA